MFGAENNLRIGFARLSPVFAALSAALFFVAAAPAKTNAEAAATASLRRQSATAQFARAEEQRAALNSKPAEKRTLADYKQVVLVYRRVAMITPRAPEVPDSLLAVAELYTEMGDRFGRAYYQWPWTLTNSWCANIRRASIARMRFCERRSCSA